MIGPVLGERNAVQVTLPLGKVEVKLPQGARTTFEPAVGNSAVTQKGPPASKTGPDMLFIVLYIFVYIRVQSFR